jgi:hypothetical protein
MPIGIALLEPPSTPKLPRKTTGLVQEFPKVCFLGALREFSGRRSSRFITSVPLSLTKIHKKNLASVEISRNL